MIKIIIFLSLFISACSTNNFVVKNDEWKLSVKEDWIIQNSALPHLRSSRWSENLVATDYSLDIYAINEFRGGQDWTAGSLCTKSEFLYGYFRARYKYAADYGGNNSFWLVRDNKNDRAGNFEIDVNEGKFPNIISVNLHDWGERHREWGKKFYVDVNGRVIAESDGYHNYGFEKTIRAKKLKIESSDYFPLRIREIVVKSNGENIAPKSGVSVSSSISDKYPGHHVIDNVFSNDSRWVSSYSEDSHFIELEWDAEVEIERIEVFSGWTDSDGKIRDSLYTYAISYESNNEWVLIDDNGYYISGKVFDLSRDYNEYSINWTPDYISYYFNGLELHRVKNHVAHLPAVVCFSLAVVDWAGPVRKSLHNKFMSVYDFKYMGYK